jgi:hypothetical protein
MLFVFALQVVSAAAAIWGLLSKTPAGPMLSLLSGLIFISMVGASSAPGKTYLQLLALLGQRRLARG